MAFVCVRLSQADQVTLKNGDTLTGTLVKKDGGKVTLKSEFLGEVTFPWDAVTAVKSDNPVFVVLPGGQEVSGKLSTEGTDLAVATAAAPITTPLTSVTALRDTAEQRKYKRLLRPGLLELWNGYVDLGLALARGNARTTTFNTALEAARVTRSDKTRLYLNEIYSTATINRQTGDTASAVRGGLAYDHNLNPRLFFNLFNDYEHDRFQNLNLRFVAGGGLGLHAINRERNRLDVLAGVSYERENFSTPLTRDSAEAYWGDDWNFKVVNGTSFTQSSACSTISTTAASTG